MNGSEGKGQMLPYTGTQSPAKLWSFAALEERHCFPVLWVSSFWQYLCHSLPLQQPKEFSYARLLVSLTVSNGTCFLESVPGIAAFRTHTLLPPSCRILLIQLGDGG